MKNETFVVFCDSPALKHWHKQAIDAISSIGTARSVAVAVATPGEFDAIDRRIIGRLRNHLMIESQNASLHFRALTANNVLEVLAFTPDFILDFSSSDEAAKFAKTHNLDRWVLREAITGRLPEKALIDGFIERRSFVHLELLRMRPQGSSREVMYRGRLPIRRDLMRTMEKALAHTAQWFPSGYVRSCQAAPLPPLDAAAASKRPAAFKRLRLLLARVRGVATLIFDQFHIDIWNIAIIPRSPSSAGRPLNWKDATWFPTSTAFALQADPCIVTSGADGATILFEHLDYAGDSKGRIMIARCSEDANPEYSIVADFAAHASYPFVVQEGQTTYVLPELNETGTTTLFTYNATSKKLDWRSTLLPDVPLCDGTLFRFEGTWWLLGTRADMEPTLHLYAWHADSVEGPWHAHELNPVKCDVTSSRPAGTPFEAGGHLIRPAQDCSDGYGGRVALNKIIKLTPSEFLEETVGFIEADPQSRYPHGIHTISVGDNVIAADGKRRIFSIKAPLLRRRADRTSVLRTERLKTRAMIAEMQ